jgi:transaldolase
VLDALRDLGVSYDDVVQVLEDEAIEKFETSWKELIDSIESEMARLADEVSTQGPAAGDAK